MRWHYSRSMPMPPLVKFGVWEHGAFIGAALFSRGSNDSIGKPYDLDMTQVCELTRVALRQHEAPVSQIMAAALQILKERNPGLRLVVSYADPAHQHVGGIYQAGNWIYAGMTPGDYQGIDRNGRVWHSRVLSATGFKTQYGKRTRVPKLSEVRRVDLPGKHRYLYPLDRAMRRKILPLAQPYPRGGSVDSDTSGLRPERAGATPAHRSEAV